MRVKLVSSTSSPELTIATAAKLCYSKYGLDDIERTLTIDEAREFIRTRIMPTRHYSVLEHASFSFYIEGISRACSHQLVRHRIASFSQQSQRYTTNNTEYITPPFGDKVAEAAFETAMELAYGSYEHLLAQGVKPENARAVLPNATTTRLIMTANAREWLHFLSLRLCVRAQTEIREVARQIREWLRLLAPSVFEYAGPPCEMYGVCFEGKGYCGKPNVTVLTPHAPNTKNNKED